MADGNGMLYTFGDPGTLRRTVTDMIRLTEPLELPCISYFGIQNQGKFSFIDWGNHKYEWWQERQRRPYELTLGADLNTTTNTDIALAAGQSVRVKRGDVWEVPSTGEQIWIKEVDHIANTVDVVRNYADATGDGEGTGQAVVAANEDLQFLFSARPEGAESDPGAWSTAEPLHNYTHIFHFQLEATGSEIQAAQRYGMSNRYAREMMKAMGGADAGQGRRGRAGHLTLELEKTFFKGHARERTSRDDAGSMGGFEHFVTTNVEDAGGAQLERVMLEDMIQACWEQGGQPNVIMCNAYNKRKISSFYEHAVRLVRSETTGGFTVNTVETEFGTLDVMLNRNVPSDRVYIAQSDLMGWCEVRPFAVEPLYKGGDYQREQIVGEYGFALEAEMYHGYLKNLATSAA